MNLIVILSEKNRKIRKTFESLLGTKSLQNGEVTFAKDWITALGYAAINPVSSVWVDWDTIGGRFQYFCQELRKVNKWLPYILIIAKNRVDGNVCSSDRQLLTIVHKDSLETDIEKILSKLSLYFNTVNTITPEYKDNLYPSGFSSFVGNSPQMLSMYNQIVKVAATDFTVLITGSSGSGKELVAKTIHELSHRRKKRFLTLNCAAIPENLLESELFGYEKGAFTDAKQAKAGKLEIADGGTVFLDEIGDMPLKLQSKLLRVLEDQKVHRLGGTIEKEVDIRLLSATHQDLVDHISNKTFREDLYYRLNVIPIKLPELSQRKQDIPLLIFFILNRLKKQNNLSIESISWELINRLQQLPLKGNVRELENILTRIIFQSSDLNLSESSLEEVLHDDQKYKAEDDQTVKFNEQVGPLWKVEKLAISHALTKLKGNISKVAEQLEISRSALYRKMKKYHLSESED